MDFGNHFFSDKETINVSFLLILFQTRLKITIVMDIVSEFIICKNIMDETNIICSEIECTVFL